jgi:hypothetical protein
MILPGGVQPTILLATTDNDVDDAFGTLIKCILTFLLLVLLVLVV